MTLDLEGHREAVADGDDTRVLPRAEQDVLSPGRQRLEMPLARLVRAVLGPHHGEDPELGKRGRATEDRENRFPLLVGQPVLPGERVVDPGLGAGAHGATASARGPAQMIGFSAASSMRAASATAPASGADRTGLTGS